MHVRSRAALAVSLAAILGGAPLAAQERPLQVALFTPIQLVPAREGALVRINLLYSVNRSVRFLDVGVVSVTTGGPSGGLQWCVLAAVQEGPFHGWQVATVSIAHGPFKGLQFGWFTSARRGEGIQWGIVNTATKWSGIQIGLVNVAQSLRGIQLGLVNIIRMDGRFPVFPVLNWSY